MSKPERSELRWAVAWAVVIVLLASLPYLWGMFITPAGYSFLGLTHNIDDGAVYLSWMRQAADGHLFIRNLFTNEPQAAMQFNLLFLAMGWFAALTRLPLIAVFHLSRIVLGIALILGIWQFSKLFLDDPKQRRLLVPLVGLSAGIGWMIPGAKAPTGSVDLWQPEAITFLSIYLNPLFLAGLLLMLGSFYWLELARREKSVRYAVFAGLHLLVLGNVHTYDVLTVACVWSAYLIALWVFGGRWEAVDGLPVYEGDDLREWRMVFPSRGVLLSLIAASIAAPSVAYQFWVYAIDPVYRLRANTPIPSPPIWSYFEGYGLVFVGAATAVVLILFNLKSKIENRKYLLPIVWSVVGFAVPYVPIAQQRKLVMGLHIPLCILCAYALSMLLSRLPGALGRIVLVGIVLLMAGSNILFLANDSRLLGEGKTVTHYSPYMNDDQLAAMRYLRAHGKSGDSIYAPPDFALFAPAMTGMAVYYGHWSETPDYSGKLLDWAAGVEPKTLEGRGLVTLLRSRASYLVAYGESGYQVSDLARPYLRRVFDAGDVPADRISVYRVRGARGAAESTPR